MTRFTRLRRIPALVACVLIAASLTSATASAEKDVARRTAGGLPAAKDVSIGPIDAEMARRSDQLVELTRIEQFVNEHPDDFAGFSSTGYDKATVYPVHGSVTAAGMTTELVSTAASKRVEVTLSPARWTLRQLTQARDTVMAKRPFGGRDKTLGYELAILPAENRVELRVPQGDVHRVSRQAAELFGDILVVRAKPAGSEVEQEQASRVNDTAPFYGGNQIRGSGENCGSGFTITNLYGERYAMTAGHCYEKGWIVSHNGRRFGEVQFRNLPVYGDPNSYWYDNELIGGESYYGAIWTGDVYNPTALPVHAAANSCLPSCQVNLSAAQSGQHLQTLSGEPFCSEFYLGWVCEQQRTTPGGADRCKSGDSGSPVFAYDGRGGVTAVGYHVAGSYAYCTYVRLPPALQYWRSTVTVE